MDFEQALLDLQTLTGDQRVSLEEALSFLSDGNTEGALETIKEVLEAQDIDPNVGGGVDRSKIPSSDFLDPQRRPFPIVTPKDVHDAVSSFGRAKPPIPFESFKSRLTSIAKRKGSECVSRLPDSWEVKASVSDMFDDEGWAVGVALAEIGKSIQIIKTGNFDHPEHGRIRITEADLKEMVRHFNSQIRGQQIPVDVDHKHELGAVGWFKALSGPKTVNGESALFADIEWTLKGEEVIKGGAFKYFSPHYGMWVNPETGEKFRNVLLSGAITNFPFLKGMQPISFNEFKEGTVADEIATVKVEDFNTLKEEVEKITKGLGELVASDARGKLAEKVEGSSKLSYDEKKALIEEIKASGLPDSDKESFVKKIEASESSDDKNKSDEQGLTALQTELSEVKGRETETAKQLKEANVRIALIEREKRTIKFMELVTGKRGDDPPWTGDVDKHMKLMESIADNLGEDSEELRSYI